jgi:hypothetical protein
MRNKEKKIEFFEMLGELTRLHSRTPNKNLARSLKTIINGILKETISLESALRTVEIKIQTSKKVESKAFWATITNTIKKYFELIG